jgi:hypothetical protein
LSFRFDFSFCFVGVRQPWKDSASVMMKRPIPLLYRGDAFSVITSSVEEIDSITSLIAVVDSGRGVAVIARTLNGLASPRLRIRSLQPAPPQLAVGLDDISHRQCVPLGRHPAMKSSVVFIPPTPAPLVAPPQPRATRRRKLFSLRLLSLGC